MSKRAEKKYIGFWYTHFMPISEPRPIETIINRKDDHIRINRDEDVQSRVNVGFDAFSLQHNALPEIDINEIDLSLTFLGKRINAPILISSMTGGTEVGDQINIRLAQSAELFGIPMGVGSQRIELQNHTGPKRIRLREFAPNTPIYANLGAVQLNYGVGISGCQQAVESLEADALILHLNPLQEALQPEGQTDFKNLIKKIGDVCKKIPVPVIVKEVGWGISADVAAKLIDAGVSCIDVAGAGGTSWALVEKFRNTDPEQIEISDHFNNWGISTTQCLIELHQRFPHFPLIASGGLKFGIDVAKSIALGATLSGFAGTVFRAAVVSQNDLNKKLKQIIDELKITMFVTGSRNLGDLACVPIQKTYDR